MSASDPVVERKIWRRLSNAIHGLKSSHYLGEKKGIAKLGAVFSRGFFQALKTDIASSVPWRSVFNKPYPQTQKEQSEIAISSFWLHIHPATITRKSLKFSTTYGLGGLCAGLFMMLVGTGVLLMFYYVPATDHAYKNMVDLQHVVSLGRLLRNMHRWSAHGLVVFVSLHMFRVFMQKAFKAPRQLNWIVGVLLLVFTMMLSFTGYLLPWDQLALWAVTVGTNMAGAIPIVGEKFRFVLLGGPSVDQATLIRFYVLHIVVLPLVMFIFMVYHFWRVRKDGFSGGE